MTFGRDPLFLAIIPSRCLSLNLVCSYQYSVGTAGVELPSPLTYYSARWHVFPSEVA